MPAAYPGVEDLKDPLPEQAVALLSNVRLGWKGLAGTNTLAPFASSSITKRENKLECLYLANLSSLV
jgi:hypothetical protein